MPDIRFRLSDGRIITATACVGDTVMKVAQAADVPGIAAECGGTATCGTCHAYLGAPWSDLVPPLDEIEREMLECVIAPRPDSRLTCQIAVTVALDGALFDIPDG